MNNDPDERLRWCVAHVIKVSSVTVVGIVRQSVATPGFLHTLGR